MFGDNFWIHNPPIWDNPIHNRCNQLKKYIEKNLCITGVSVCRCHVGSRLYYNVSFKSYTKYGAFEELFEGISTGLVEFDSPTQHHIYLVDEVELHDKYLVGENLVFEEPFNFIYAFHENYDDIIKKQSDKIISVFCDNMSDLCLIHIKEGESPSDVLRDLKVKICGEYWSHSHNMLVINMEYVELEE